jgi:ribulose-bisphosphate carboxylase large chain
VTSRLIATYVIRADARDIDARARSIAIEQSVEMPVTAIPCEAILADIVGRVETITDLQNGTFAARISLSVATMVDDAGRGEPGQLVNMLFGNSSIHDDVSLFDVEFSEDFAASFHGPNHGMDGLRSRVGAGRRAMTCSALKPLGQSCGQLAALASTLALGGLDYIKDDHGLADQAFSPFAARVAAVMNAVRAANASTGRSTRYVPSLSGNLDALRRQISMARDHGIDTVLIAPMVTGLASFATIAHEARDMAFLTHPAMAGSARIAPAALLGKLFRLMGADGVIYPNAGGRFGYTHASCRSIAATALADWHSIKPVLPIPAGGMTRARVPELLAIYGPDVMLLIGGDLLVAGKEMTAEAAAFQRSVETYAYNVTHDHDRS